MKLAHTTATFGCRQSVGHFHQNPVGREQAGAKVAGEFEHALVMLITTVEPRHEVEGIGKDEAHGRGWP
jgi:hypothetical protein